MERSGAPCLSRRGCCRQGLQGGLISGLPGVVVARESEYPSVILCIIIVGF